MPTRFNHEDVRASALEYYGGNALSTDAWMLKYSLRDEFERFVELTPEHTQERLAREFARIEAKYPNPLSYEQILALFKDWHLIIPQGSPMSAIGNPFMVQSLSNCFVVDGALDSYAGIMHTDQEQAQIMKRRGGVGHDISNIRPRDMRVSNAARTTAGIGPYMERFSQTTREVGQDGRRGALMLTLSCRHPELETFLLRKRDLSLVTGANISVWWHDDFLEAVEADSEYTLRWPCDASIEDAKVTKVVRAKALWDTFIESAWLCAEPGALFVDTIRRESISDAYADVGFRTVCTNPCQPAWATVLTPTGISTIGAIQVGDQIWSGKRWTRVVRKWGTGTKDVYAFRTRAGTFYGTEEHRVVERGRKVEVKDAKSIDSAQGRLTLADVDRTGLVSLVAEVGYFDTNGLTLRLGTSTQLEQVQNLLSSIGIRALAESANDTYCLHITSDRHLLAEITGTRRPYFWVDGEHHNRRTPNTFDIREVEKVSTEEVFDITVEDEEHTYWSGGLLVSNCGEIPLSAYDACRLMVVNLMGAIRDPFTPEATVDWDLLATTVRLAQRLMDDLIDLEIEAIDRILAKVEADPEPEHIKRVEIELWQKIRKANLDGRRTGLGYTAVGDCLASLGLTYGTPSSLDMVERFYMALAVNSEIANTQLAKELGHFPVWNAAKERDNTYLRRVQGAIDTIASVSDVAQYRADYAVYGRRNISTTTTAPVGTISMQACVYRDNETRVFGTTSGIEPVPIAVEMVRRRKIQGSIEGQQVDFIDPKGDAWQEYTVRHPGYEVWCKLNPGKSLEESPYHQATSRDIDWEASVDMQAAAQRWVSHSISKTCNLPKDVSKELVSACYLRAWKAGCKGFTVYREGSRTGVLVDKSEKSSAAKSGVTGSGALTDDGRPVEGIVESHAPKRPAELPCDIHFTRVKGEAWVVFVGLLNGRPYEVFAGQADRVIALPRKHAQGRIVKRRRVNGVARYDLILGAGDDELIVQDIVTTFDDPENGAFSRALSLALRHGVPVQYAVEQLQRDKHSDFTRFSSVLARVLKRYITSGATVSTEKACPVCGAKPLTYQEGCATCTACGWAKC